MDIRQLRHFLAVAETLHFGKAAEKLFMTQPPLSQSIMALERSLGSLLFNRTKRSVRLTPFGQQWLINVREALEKIDGLEEKAKLLRMGYAGTLELSFVSTAVYNFLPVLVHRFREAFPSVELSLTELTSEKQISSLYEGQRHAGIVVKSEEISFPSSLAYESLDSEPLIAAIPASWVAAKRIKLSRNRISQKDVLSSPLIIFPRYAAPVFYDLVIKYYATCGGVPYISQHAIQMQTIIGLVSAGIGIALVPASLRNLARSGVYYCDLSGHPPLLETGLIYRHNEESPAVSNLLKIISELKSST